MGFMIACDAFLKRIERKVDFPMTNRAILISIKFGEELIDDEDIRQVVAW
jgi:hypothetical protein